MNYRLCRSALLSEHVLLFKTGQPESLDMNRRDAFIRLKLVQPAQDDDICVMRMMSHDDFLGHQAPMRNRSLRVAIIVQAIASIAFFTVHGTVGITHQPELGRTSTEFNCFRMHPADYATSCAKNTLYR